jgi:hypothetical protein
LGLGLISLGYADITEEVAQKASCLAPKTFSSTLRTVKTAIHPSKTPNASPSKSGNQVDATAYAALISEHKIGQPLRVESWMKEAQETLTTLPRFRQDFAVRHSESSPEVRLAVFFWVCRAIKVRSINTLSQPSFPFSFTPHAPMPISSRTYNTSRW